uniref:C2HC/C3H-type domain-containing protein n=1 Tax=Eutreptiella gymnastica TaxID=73025 RepID=A0A7S1NJR8_9EUGL|mmetsp:Transcript_49147/g.87714  ORF Transcript_49147/g.87714 Transcript_49147/m.87714 type:complete len:588 (+) Transcript_49147:145-1908(+)
MSRSDQLVQDYARKRQAQIERAKALRESRQWVQEEDAALGCGIMSSPMLATSRDHKSYVASGCGSTHTKEEDHHLVDSTGSNSKGILGHQATRRWASPIVRRPKPIHNYGGGDADPNVICDPHVQRASQHLVGVQLNPNGWCQMSSTSVDVVDQNPIRGLDQLQGRPLDRSDHDITISNASFSSCGEDDRADGASVRRSSLGRLSPMPSTLGHRPSRSAEHPPLGLPRSHSTDSASLGRIQDPALRTSERFESPPMRAICDPGRSVSITANDVQYAVEIGVVTQSQASHLWEIFKSLPSADTPERGSRTSFDDEVHPATITSIPFDEIPVNFHPGTPLNRRHSISPNRNPPNRRLAYAVSSPSPVRSPLPFAVQGAGYTITDSTPSHHSLTPEPGQEVTRTADVSYEAAETDDVQGLKQIRELHLERCGSCNRNFRLDVLAKHEQICQRVYGNTRKPFNPMEQRMPQEAAALCRAVEPIGSDDRPLVISAGMASLPPGSQQSSLPSGFPDPEDRPVQLSGAAEGSCPHSIRSTLTEGHEEDRQECPHCHRWFNPDAHARHVPKCKFVKARPGPPPKPNQREMVGFCK